MTHTYDLQLRYNDTDALGHVNNALYATYAESARIAFFREAGVPVENLILARLEVDYRRQVRFGESPTVESFITKVGHTSVGVGHRLLVGGEVAAEMRTVVVYFDYEAGVPTRVPDTARAALGRYEEGE